MDVMSIVIIVVLTCIGFACGIAIYIANKRLPEESEELQKTGRIADVLPGMNCGACGKPGCFAYAQALAADPDTIKETPCMTALKDPNCVSQLESLLGFSLDASSMDKKAVVHCVGHSDDLFDYKGVPTCKSAALLSGGFKRCPYGCLGLGDCADVCPQGAISIGGERGVAVVDPAKCIGCGLCVEECPHGLISLVPGGQQQYLGCSYSNLKSIPGRDRCEQGCIKCRKCVKASPDGQVTWDNSKNLPSIGEAAAREAMDACPVKVIVAIKK